MLLLLICRFEITAVRSQPVNHGVTPAVCQTKTNLHFIAFSLLSFRQCSLYICKRFYYANVRKVTDFEFEVSSYENNTFRCFNKDDKVVLSKSYSTLAFVNCLLLPSLGIVVGGMGILCPCLNALVTQYNSELGGDDVAVTDATRKHRLSWSLSMRPPLIETHGRGNGY